MRMVRRYDSGMTGAMEGLLFVCSSIKLDHGLLPLFQAISPEGSSLTTRQSG